MYFRQLHARNFRLLKDIKLDLHPGLNFVVGGNGAGKTTVLEALYVLGRTGSYRGSAQQLVRDGETAWSLQGQLVKRVSAPDDKLEIRYSDHRLTTEINGEVVVLSELVRAVPILLLDPLTHRLIEEGPEIRRRYIDWGVFHMEQRFHSAWLRFNRALRQRNAALRARANDEEMSGWDQELVNSGIELTAMRSDYVAELKTTIAPYWKALLGDTDWRLKFYSGWREEFEYLELLEKNLDSDRKLGYTREGPHRAELLVLSDNKQLKNRISRGQQKLLIAALVLAQGELYRQRHEQVPLLLVDDFSAELSEESQDKLLRQLLAYAGQKVVAALDYSRILKNNSAHSMFHMEHGTLTTMQTK